VGRLSRVDALKQQAMAQAEERRSKQRLLTVVNALRRLETDDYGDCMRCGEEVSDKRLKASPETPFCVACAR